MFKKTTPPIILNLFLIYYVPLQTSSLRGVFARSFAFFMKIFRDKHISLLLILYTIHKQSRFYIHGEKILKDGIGKEREKERGGSYTQNYSYHQ